MDELLFNGYELATVLIPFVILLGIQKKRGLHMDKISVVASMIFGIYLTGVYHFTGASTIYEGFYYHFQIPKDKINLIPFSNSIDVTGYLLNILLLMPFGLILPFLWRKMNDFKRITLAGFCFSLLIELSQLLNLRSTDIDDLLLNTLGAVVGWILFKIFDTLTESKYQCKDIPDNLMIMSIFITFMGHFLLFNEMRLADWLYDFSLKQTGFL